MVSDHEREKALVGQAAAELVADGTTLGLGTGSTVRHFAETLGRRIAEQNLRVTAILTSRWSREIAERTGIPLVDWGAVEALDLCVDGADEVDPDLSMIKGGGGALLWEKIVASASRQRVFIADSTKLVPRLGRFPLPVEVSRFGHELQLRRLEARAGRASLRQAQGMPFVTDSGNYIIDCQFDAIEDAGVLDAELKSLPGVIETGLFVAMVDELITCRAGQVVRLRRGQAAWWGGEGTITKSVDGTS